MTQAKNKKGYNYQLRNIEILNFSIVRLSKPIKKPEKYNYELNINQKSSSDNNLVFIIVNISISNSENQEKLGELSVSCIFEVDELKSFELTKEGLIIVPEDLNNALNTISISTVRGVMFSQFKGTFLHNAILPIIDVTMLKRNE